jgi:hypothetical protein
MEGHRLALRSFRGLHMELIGGGPGRTYLVLTYQWNLLVAKKNPPLSGRVHLPEKHGAATLRNCVRMHLEDDDLRPAWRWRLFRWRLLRRRFPGWGFPGWRLLRRSFAPNLDGHAFLDCPLGCANDQLKHRRLFEAHLFFAGRRDLLSVQEHRVLFATVHLPVQHRALSSRDEFLAGPELDLHLGSGSSEPFEQTATHHQERRRHGETEQPKQLPFVHVCPLSLPVRQPSS